MNRLNILVICGIAGLICTGAFSQGNPLPKDSKINLNFPAPNPGDLIPNLPNGNSYDLSGNSEGSVTPIQSNDLQLANVTPESRSKDDAARLSNSADLNSKLYGPAPSPTPPAWLAFGVGIVGLVTAIRKRLSASRS